MFVINVKLNKNKNKLWNGSCESDGKSTAKILRLFNKVVRHLFTVTIGNKINCGEIHYTRVTSRSPICEPCERQRKEGWNDFARRMQSNKYASCHQNTYICHIVQLLVALFFFSFETVARRKCQLIRCKIRRLNG